MEASWTTLSRWPTRASGTLKAVLDLPLHSEVTNKSSCTFEQHQDTVMEYMLVSECGQKSNRLWKL